MGLVYNWVTDTGPAAVGVMSLLHFYSSQSPQTRPSLTGAVRQLSFSSVAMQCQFMPECHNQFISDIITHNDEAKGQMWESMLSAPCHFSSQSYRTICTHHERRREKDSWWGNFTRRILNENIILWVAAAAIKENTTAIKSWHFN